MTRAQKQTLAKMRKKRQLKCDSNGFDHLWKSRKMEIWVTTKDGDDLAILPNGLAVSR